MSFKHSIGFAVSLILASTLFAQVRRVKTYEPDELGRFTTVAFSEDAKTYATVQTSEKGSHLIVRSTDAHEEQMRIEISKPRNIFAAYFTRDDAIICFGERGVAQIKLNGKSNDEPQVISHVNKLIAKSSRRAVNPDGSSYSVENKVFSCKSGELLFEVAPNISGAAFSRDGRFATIRPKNAKKDHVSFFDESGTLTHELTIATSASSLQISHDRSALLTINQQGRPSRYDAGCGSWDWSGNSGPGDNIGRQRSLVETLDGHKLVMLSADKRIRVFDARGGFSQYSVFVEGQTPTQIATSNSHFACVCKGGSVCIWDFSTFKTETEIRREKIRREIAAVEGDQEEAIKWLNSLGSGELYTKCSLSKIHMSNVSYGRSPITDDWLEILVNFPDLQELSLHNAHLTDNGIRRLWAVPSLEKLAISGSRLSDQSIIRIAPLVKLRVLSLEGSKITDAALSKLGKRPALRELVLTGTNVTDHGMATIGQYDLRRLDLGSTGLTDNGMQSILRIKGLEYLGLSNTKITDRGMKGIGELQNLRSLGIHSVKGVTDESLSMLAKLDKLESLHADYTRIQFENPDVSKLSRVKTLSLEGAAVTDDAMKQIGTLENLEWLNLIGTKVSDGGLKHLHRLKNLKRVYLRATKVSNEGMRRLREAIPGCDVNQRWLG